MRTFILLFKENVLKGEREKLQFLIDFVLFPFLIRRKRAYILKKQLQQQHQQQPCQCRKPI